MPRPDAADLARRLGSQAEAVCRRYLSNGRRRGRYWQVGDIRNSPGRSLYVRLTGPDSGRGAAGRWTDAATGDHGDLLDLIRQSLGLADFRDVADEARRFLCLPHQDQEPSTARGFPAAPAGSNDAARRLFAMSRPIAGTVVEAYLRRRGITVLHGDAALRFHPSCLYRADDHASVERWPAMIAAVTDCEGLLTGVHRTWLRPDGQSKAPVDTPRRAMGELRGHAVRFGVPGDVMAAGEGIETMLSLRCVLPALPMAAALSAAHLAAFLFPQTLRRLYIACDNDPAGEGAMTALAGRAACAGIDAITLSPRLGDFNEDLAALAPDSLRAARADRAPGRRALHGPFGLIGSGGPGRAAKAVLRRDGSSCLSSQERTAPMAF